MKDLGSPLADIVLMPVLSSKKSYRYRQLFLSRLNWIFRRLPFRHRNLYQAHPLFQEVIICLKVLWPIFAELENVSHNLVRSIDIFSYFMYFKQHRISIIS